VVFSVVASGGGLTYKWFAGGVEVVGQTNPSITVTAPSATIGYTVRVTNSVGSVTSNVATLTVLQPPVITTQPLTQTVFQGSRASFTIAATGPGTTLSYQWYKSGVLVTGATTTSYSFTTTAADVTASPITIRCVVTNVAGSTPSTDAVLTVLVPPPAITVQPVGGSTAVRSSRTFSVTATGPSLTYQWYKGGVAVSGATAASFSTVATDADFAASPVAVYVVVSNPAGSVTSNVASLTVTAASVSGLSVTSLPAAVSGVVTTTSGNTVTFTATATGGGLTYQWRSNPLATGGTFTDIVGATGASYTTPAVTTSMTNTRYLVVVKNSVTTAGSTSASIRLAVPS
jgi:hypothetical protein